MKFEYEQIGPYSYRAKVQNGWIVYSVLFYTKKWFKLISVLHTGITHTFIYDPKHKWEIDK